MSRRIGQSSSLLWGGIVTLFLAFAVMGCESTPEDELMDGRQALTVRDADRAEEHLRAAIEANPELLEARRLMADVHMLRADYDLAEEVLDELWTELSFDIESDLDPDQRRTRMLMTNQYTNLYRKWAESIDYGERPESFESVAKTGLERNRRDSRLNSLMVEYYRARADEFVVKNDRLQAARMLEQIDELHTFTDTRREAREQARQLRREAFRDQAQERFETELRPDLVEAEAYDEQSRTIYLTVEQSLDRRLDPDDSEAVDLARMMAAQTLLPRLGQYALSLGGLEVESVEFSALEIPGLRIVDETFHSRRYDMVVGLTQDDLFDMAFDYAEYERLRPEDQPRIQAEPQIRQIVVEGDRISVETKGLDEGD